MAKSLSKSLLLLTRTLHIYLSTLALLLLMFFAVTGFIMNHGEWFGVEKPTEADLTTTVPDAIMHPASAGGPQQQAIINFLHANQGIHGEMEGWSETDDPIHLVFKTPRFRYEVDITRADGKTALHTTTFSTTGFLAKLHKGDDTGAAWHRIIDATSILLALISITGLILWISLAKRRVLGVISLVACVVIVAAVFWACVP